MRARAKQTISSIFFIVVLVVVFYTFYFDKPTFLKSDSSNRQSQISSETGSLTAENTVGKVITRNEKGWTIDQKICHQNYDFVLAHLKDPPHTPIFVYTTEEDKWVSGSIIAHGAWEGGHVGTIHNYMKKFPHAVFLDIGANIGMFSISIAAHGYRVISIDCLKGNVMRLCASMKAAKLTDKMTVVYNALSHTHEKVSLGKYHGNVGGTYVKQGTHNHQKGTESVNSIFLDDLLEIYSFDQVVIKMDVETFEANVLKGGYKFFEQVKVEALLMEFVAHREKESGKFIADFLISHGLEPNVADNVKNDYTKWGNEVLFLRKSKVAATVTTTLPTVVVENKNKITITLKNEALGKIISYSGNKWTSDENFCPTDTSKFVSTKLGHPYNVPMFVYTMKEDQWVSGRIIQGGIWEEDLVNKVIAQMDNFPNAVFIDIGSNIGVFSLAVASKRRTVISIDCLKGNVERLCNSIKSAGFDKRMTIVYNALSNERKNFSLGTYEGNVGGTYIKEPASGDSLISSILLDDLVPLFELKEVVVKMDVETHEANVLHGAKKFFDSVKVHYFLLEFVSHKGKPSGSFISNFFDSYGMEPILPSTSQLADTSTWPNEVAWRRKKGGNTKNEEKLTVRDTEKRNIPETQNKFSHSKKITSDQETLGKVISRSSFVQEWTEANFSCQAKSNFVRANLNRDRNTPIYVYTQEEDKWVSGSIIRNGNWEGDLVQNIAVIFNEFPDATFLDIGANVGMFSLSLAKHGKRVIAFDCLKGNVERLCASMKANAGFENRMTIVYNALSNQREKVTLGTYSGNVGGTFVKKITSNTENIDNTVDSILLDDILEIFKFDNKVIIKMDVETFELKILEGADKFFSTVEVEAIVLEFVSHRGNKSGTDIIQFLEKHKLFPVLGPGMDRYDTKTWKKGEVMFRRKNS
ncbi:uncharacterized protein LOC134711536 [Mytilus trossulus]|uniref:uncharacterized protein LOC134711536 n=1 Tax=Mytilus trossulus TaxID=6551 RepID=UPI0030041E3F